VLELQGLSRRYGDVIALDDLPEERGQTFSPLFACLQACHRHAGDAGIDTPAAGLVGGCPTRDSARAVGSRDLVPGQVDRVV
jgi:hypothetical protein